MNDAGDDVPTPASPLSPEASDGWLRGLAFYLQHLQRFDTIGRHGLGFGGTLGVAPWSASEMAEMIATEALGTFLGLRPDWGGEYGIERLHWAPRRGMRFVGLRRIEALALDWGPRHDTDGRWLVLLGENGTGKTTILRALALAHSPDSVASACLGALPGALVRHGHTMAAVLVADGEGSSTPRARVIRRASRVDESMASHAPEGSYPVFGYGCQRGSALGVTQGRDALKPLAQVATLFDERASVLNADYWLSREYNRMQSEGAGSEASRVIVETACRVLAELLPGVDDVTVTPDGTRVVGPGVGAVELTALSDGYLSTIGWLIDLMARWVEIRRDLGHPIERDFNQRMTGLVLVDEVDEHLHPRWQGELLPMLRRAFPRLDFIVTTHNPMTLRGARPGEVYVLEDDDGRITARQVDLAPGARADQVLTGPWFQLSSALVDEETLRLYRDHAQMLREGVPPDDGGRLALEDELRGRLEFFVETAEERVALDIAAQHMRTYAELDHEQRIEVRRKIEALFDREMKRRDA